MDTDVARACMQPQICGGSGGSLKRDIDRACTCELAVMISKILPPLLERSVPGWFAIVSRSVSLKRGAGPFLRF